jgi:uncharacterized membrane protein YdbT with pleckstrin-like domain
MSAKTPPKSEKQFPGQHEGEEVQLLFRQHPLVMRKPLIIGLIVILVGVLPLDFPFAYENEQTTSILVKIALIVPLFVFAAWFYRWIGWYYTVFIVTDRRILAIKQHGLFSRRVDEWQLDAIQSVNYEIGGFQAVLFGYGDITAKTYIGDFDMKTIHKPVEIHEQLVEAVKRGGGGSAQPLRTSGSTQPGN